MYAVHPAVLALVKAWNAEALARPKHCMRVNLKLHFCHISLTEYE